MIDDIPLRADVHSSERCERLLAAWTIAMDFGLKSQLLSVKTESSRDVFDDMMGKVLVELNARTIGQRSIAKREVLPHDEEQSLAERFVG